MKTKSLVFVALCSFGRRSWPTAILGVGSLAAVCVMACDAEPPPVNSAASASAAGTALAPSGLASGGVASSAEPVAKPAAKPAPYGLLGLDARKTTRPDLVVKRVNSAVRGAERMFEGSPKSLSHRARLVSALLERAATLGTVSDLDRVVELGEGAVTQRPKEPNAYLIRARTRAAVHRFDEALADLAKASELKADPDEIAKRRGVLLMALGKYDEAHAIFVAARKKKPDTSTWALEGMVLGRMGKLEQAEANFVQAERAFRSVSPIPLATLYFERASLWDRNGEPKKAEVLYRAAVARLPQHSHAVGHLAGLVSAEEAVTLLEGIMATSDDPEHLATLGAAKNEIEAGSGAADIAKAKTAYAALMKRHPLAFADHAGWFWVNVAEQYDEALPIAAMNLKARATPEAYELMLAAQLGAKKHAAACETAEAGLKHKYPSPSLKAYAAAAFKACGKPERAEALGYGAGHGHDRGHGHSH